MSKTCLPMAEPPPVLHAAPYMMNMLHGRLTLSRLQFSQVPPVRAGFSSPPSCVSFPLPLMPLPPSSLVSTIWELSVSLALEPQGRRQTQASSMFIWGSARTRPRGEAARCRYMLRLCTPPRREQITHLLLLGHVNGNCPVLPQGLSLSLSLLRTSTLRSRFTQAVMVAMPNLVEFGCVDTQRLFAHCPSEWPASIFCCSIRCNQVHTWQTKCMIGPAGLFLSPAACSLPSPLFRPHGSYPGPRKTDDPIYASRVCKL
ncbi:hypothetical protein X797_000822 [Metarhizium robertsii]|uniref:Uncharacterized protein n=1 Tax=Metarhizium robertsii TaxID=568076 RepID=A0A0A1V8B5_9HYPO|nr:hypothetical protein X797_000822 [Metarhizium robertsii]